MIRKLGVFGLMLAAGVTALMRPATAFGQDRYDRENNLAYYGRDDHREYRENRDYDRDFRGREWRERARREREWRERERWQERGYRYGYEPGYRVAPPYYVQPY